MAAGEAYEVEVDGHDVRVSNPDKVYFPDATAGAITKRELIEYYRAVAPVMVTALRDRPTYMQRFPDGVTGEEIYQKRLPRHAPPWMSTCRVHFPSGRHADALRVRSEADIVWAANYGCVTFHPWHARCQDTEHPDEWRIDLDPQPGTAFDDARAVALEVVRPLLAELGYEGFPKTSGSKGLHVYVRIRPEWSFIEVRRAAIAFAREVDRRADGRVTTAWWKEQRGSQVFVDYNQNARDRTIASAWSVRQSADGMVSLPVTWSELADVDPRDCTLRTVPDLLARRGDPHADIDAVSHSLATLLEMAEKDEAGGLEDLPYPPNYPKMPGEPKRVQPSRKRDLSREDRLK
jgi:DNA ligase D